MLWRCLRKERGPARAGGPQGRQELVRGTETARSLPELQRIPAEPRRALRTVLLRGRTPYPAWV